MKKCYNCLFYVPPSLSPQNLEGARWKCHLKDEMIPRRDAKEKKIDCFWYINRMAYLDAVKEGMYK